MVDAILYCSFKQYSAESAAEVLVEDCINEGIQCRVGVAEPKSDYKGLRGYIEIRKDRFDDVKDKEGQPTGDKAAHYEA